MRAARTAAALVAALALVGAPALPAAAAGAPVAAASATAGQRSLPLQLQLRQLRPRAPQPGDIVHVTARLTNTSDKPVDGLFAELRIGGVLSSRSALAAFAEGGDAYFPGRQLPQTRVDITPRALPPGQHTDVTLSLDVGKLRLSGGNFGGTGVYPLGVTAYATGSVPVARLRTLLPWAPTDTLPKPTRLAWIWPLVDRPHRAASTTFRDDRLAGSFADGRLHDLLTTAAQAAVPPAVTTPAGPTPAASPGASPSPGRAGSGPAPATPARPPIRPQAVPVTWAVDPLLVQDAALMSHGYRVGNTTHGSGSAGATAAGTWLQQLRHAVAAPSADLMLQPYADPDLTSLVHAGLAHDVSSSLTTWAAQAEQTLQVTPTERVVWPPDGLLDLRTLQTVAGAGAQAVVVSDRALPTAEELTYTPTAHVQIAIPSGTVDGVVTDSALNDVVDDGAAHPARAALDEQRFLAETLLVTLERPGEQRDVVVAPERRWSPSQGYAAALLADTGNVPWLDPITVRDVRSDPVSDIARARITYPDSTAAAGLPPDYLAEVRRLRSSYQEFSTILTKPDAELPSELDRGILRTESSAWRDQLGQGVALRDDVAAALASARQGVRIVSSGLVTLTSDSGTVPVTVENALDQPVRVRLHLDAGPQAVIAQGGSIPLTLAPRSTPTQYVGTSTKVAGVFRLTTWLTPARSDLVLGDTVTLRVRSTVYGALAIGITLGALAVLLVAVAVRLTRRALRARRNRRPGAA